MSPAKLASPTALADLLMQGPIMLYDGQCVFCNGAATFAFKHEVEPRLRFASLQSSIGQRLLSYYGLPQTNFKTFVVINEQKAYTRFEAAVQLGYLMGGNYARLASVMDVLIPNVVGNPIYSLLWPMRKLFGSRQQCILPDASMRVRVIDI